MNININIYNENCLILACWENQNINIIKSLIKDCKMNVNFKDNIDYNCLLTACYGNKNINIIKYLIEDCKLDPNLTNNDKKLSIISLRK